MLADRVWSCRHSSVFAPRDAMDGGPGGPPQEPYAGWRGGALEVRATAHPGPSDYVEAIQAFLEHSLRSRALNSELPLADRSLEGNLYTTAHTVDR
jgi:hypothetical protein